MKGKFIALTVIMSSILSLGGCVVKPKDTNDVKIIEKSQTEETQKEVDSAGKNTKR